MAGFDNSKGNMGFLKKKFNQNLAAGEKLQGAEFEMVIEGYSELTTLIRTTQTPGMARADVEDYGPGGLLFVQQGAIENSGEIAVTLRETIKADVIKAFKKIIFKKEYVNIIIRYAPESSGGSAPDGGETRLLHCRLRSDPIEHSSEDAAALVAPSMTIRYNWIDEEG